MKRIAVVLALTLSTTPLALLAQSYSSSVSLVAPDSDSDASQMASPVGRSYGGGGYEGPVSRYALAGAISPLGIQLQAVTNITGHINFRATGNYFSYSDNFTSNGISANAKLNLQSAGASIDLYPFRRGFRISPGVLVTNQNRLSAATNVPAGSSFTLNDTTYYSANANAVTGATPIVGTAALGLHTSRPAFSITAGWGNTARGDGHWSFPVDIGVAFIGAPNLTASLTGWACLDQAQTMCSNLADPANPIAAQVQSNLNTQIAKWTSDLNPLKTYPILSAGVAYSFRVR